MSERLTNSPVSSLTTFPITHHTPTTLAFFPILDYIDLRLYFCLRAFALAVPSAWNTLPDLPTAVYLLGFQYKISLFRESLLDQSVPPSHQSLYHIALFLFFMSHLYLKFRSFVINQNWREEKAHHFPWRAAPTGSFI